jgi:aspartate kinase
MQEIGKMSRRQSALDITPLARSRTLVQKFGGTSVASIEHIARVARRIIEARDAGSDVVVVVSAMSGETDRLLALARQATPRPEPSELDVLAATGEQITAALTAMTIQGMGHKARSFLGHQVKIITDSSYSDARIRQVDRARIDQALAAGEIVVLAGFQGIDQEERITTLGRGGSDTTAVALAAALEADACEIYTDVDGVYTADPRLCPSARRLERVSYRQMLAFSSLGAKVLNHRSVALAMKYLTPIHVRTSFSSAPGTWVVDDDQAAGAGEITGIAQDTNLACIRVIEPDGSGQEAAVLVEALARHRIKLDRVTPSAMSTTRSRPEATMVVRKSDLDRALGVIGTHKRAATEVETDLDISKVSVVGTGLHGNSALAARIIRLLSEADIPIRSLSRTELSISCLLDAVRAASAIRVLHEALGLSAAGSDPGHSAQTDSNPEQPSNDSSPR